MNSMQSMLKSGVKWATLWLGMVSSSPARAVFETLQQRCLADGLGYADDGDELDGSDFESDEDDAADEELGGQVGEYLLVAARTAPATSA